jgi:Family of unknown function (DUF6174)
VTSCVSVAVVASKGEDRRRMISGPGDVRWNDELGYPAQIAIDYTDGTDDEVNYRVTSFEVD